MADGNIFLDMKADASGMLRALEMVYTAVEKNTKAVEKQKNTMTDLDKEAKRVMQSVMTDEEKRAQKLERINFLREKGKLTEEQYRMAVIGTLNAQESLTSQTFKMAAALGGIAAVQQTIVAALNAEYELRQKIAGIHESAAGGMGRLMQMASTPEEAKRLMAGAQKLRERGAAGSLSQAADLMFTIESAGLGANFDTISRIGATGLFQDTNAMAASVNQMKQAFGGDAGDFNAILSKSLVGGGMLNATAEQFMAAVSRASGPGGETSLGLSDEQVSAFVTSIGDTVGVTRTPEIAAATLRALTKLGYTGKSMEEIRADIAKKNLSPQQLIQFLGESQAAEGYAAFDKNYAKYRQALPQFEAANSGAMLEERLRIAENALGVGVELRQQAGEEEVGLYGDRYRALLAAAQRSEAVGRRQRFGPFLGGVIQGADDLNTYVNTLGRPRVDLINRVGLAAQGDTMDAGLFREIIKELQKNNDITAEMARTLTDQYEKTRQAAPQSQPQKEQ